MKRKNVSHFFHCEFFPNRLVLAGHSKTSELLGSFEIRCKGLNLTVRSKFKSVVLLVLSASFPMGIISDANVVCVSRLRSWVLVLVLSSHT